MKTLAYLVVCCLSLTFAHPPPSPPLRFAACKDRLLGVNTGISLRNKDWKGKQFVNVATKPQPKCDCLWTYRWTELDTSTQPPFVIFHQKFHWTFDAAKGQAKLSELYQVQSDHYVFRYTHGAEKANVHVKWLKLIPGVLEVQYMCSDDFMFAENDKDFVLVLTPTATFPRTVSDLTKNVLLRADFKLKSLFMVPNCDCATKKHRKAKSCDNKPLVIFLK